MRRGWGLLRQRLGDVVVMGLILFALSLGFTLVAIPVFFLVLAVAAVGGGLPALLAYAVTSLVVQGGAAPWIVATIVYLPIFIVILAIPLALLGGLVETFRSSTWTLTYRELLALEAARRNGHGQVPPAPSAPELPAAPDAPRPA